MKKSTGYKEMLRDRCPKVVDFALKWCQAKERWIDHAYAKFVKNIGSEWKNDKQIRTANDCKKIVTRSLLGIKKGKPKYFVFDKSIDWDNLTNEETLYWKNVSSWVRWFMEDFKYLENTYNHSRYTLGRSEFDCKVELIQRHLSSELPKETDDDETKERKYAYLNKLVDYVVKCIEEIKQTQ